MKLIDSKEFWTWAFSDFMSNALRGVLAEYIVGSALNCTSTPRAEWDAYDLKTADGTKIEVKSSAYLQTWEQKQHSTIRFDIGLKKAWDAKTNNSQKEATRAADVYVFSIFASTEKTTANPLDTSQWFFLACSSEFLKRMFGKQSSVCLASLEQKGLKRILFDHLNNEIDKCKWSLLPPADETFISC